MTRHQLWTAPCPGVQLERVLDWVAEGDPGESTVVVPGRLLGAQAAMLWSARNVSAAPRFWTWSELWRGVRARAGRAPALMTAGQRRQVLRESILRADADGSLERAPHVTESAGFERFVTERIEAWTRAGLTASANCPSPAEAWAFGVFRHYRRIAKGLVLEDEAGLAVWGARHLDSLQAECSAIAVLHADLLDAACVEVLKTLHGMANRMLVTLTCPVESKTQELYADCLVLREKIRGLGFESHALHVEQPASDTPAAVADALTRGRKRRLKSSLALRHIGVPLGDGEAMAAADAVMRWVREGVPLHSIAVAVAGADELAEATAARLRDEGVPVSEGYALPAHRDPAVAALLRALKVAAAGWDRRTLAGLLRHNAVRPAWVLDDARVEPALAAAGLDRVPVSRGFDALQRGLLRELERLTPKGKSSALYVSRAVRELRAAQFALERLGPRVQAVANDATYSVHVRALREIAQELGLEELASPALACFMNSLETAADLATRLNSNDRGWTCTQFAREATRLAEECRVEVEFDTRASVQVAAVDDLAGASHTHRVIVGLQEGVFPDRARVESGSLLGLVAQWRAFINLFASSNRSVVLVYPTTDENGQALGASSFLEDLTGCYTRDAWADCGVSHNRLTPEVVARFDALHRGARLKALRDAASRAGYASLRDRAAGWVSVGSLQGVAIALRTARRRLRQSHAGPFDGMMSTVDAAKTASRIAGADFSVRELESYAQCPFLFFQSSILRLEETGTDELGDDPRAIGSAAHALLAKVHALLPTFEGAEGLATALRRAITAAAESESAEQAEPVSQVERGYRRYVLERTARFLRGYALDYEQYRAQLPEVVHEHFELRFGPGTDVVLEFETAGAARFKVSGKIDRVDRLRTDAGEHLRVIDYRSGSVATKSDVKRGLALEGSISLLAAEVLARRRDGCGVLDAGCWSLKGAGYSALVQREGGAGPTWAERRAELVRYLSAMVESIRRGCYPVAPRMNDCETRCSYSHVCRIGEIRPLNKKWTDAPRLGDAAGPPEDS